MNHLTLEQAVAKASALPALPQIVLRILDTLSDEGAHADTLSDHVASDPAVLARLLSAANSSAFGQTHRIDSVRQIVARLGVGRVREITMATAIIDRFVAVPPFDAHKLWLHSVGTAICAQEIAAQTGLSRETAYAAGLLHDIGQLLLFGVSPFDYAEAMRLITEQDMGIIEAERQVFGVDHAAVGGELARRWMLPQGIVDAISGHHADDESGDRSEMADLVHVAEGLSQALGLGVSAESRVPLLSELSCARMGIEWGSFASTFPRIEARFDSARLMLGL